MLKKENRLKKRKAFNYMYRNGVRFYSDNLIMIKTATKLPNSLIGFAVNNKIGNAVVRNKIKRRLRAIVAEQICNINRCNLIFVAKEGIGNVSYSDLENEVKKLLKKSSSI